MRTISISNRKRLKEKCVQMRKEEKNSGCVVFKWHVSISMVLLFLLHFFNVIHVLKFHGNLFNIMGRFDFWINWPRIFVNLCDAISFLLYLFIFFFVFSINIPNLAMPTVYFVMCVHRPTVIVKQWNPVSSIDNVFWRIVYVTKKVLKYSYEVHTQTHINRM